MKRLGVGMFAVLVTTGACGGDSPAGPTDGPAAFAFLEGSWEVTTRRSEPGGTSETVGGERVQRELDGTVWKGQWVGERAGAPVEVQTLYALGENEGEFIIARGDGGEGTFDVLVGDLAEEGGTFTSRPGTRPDGGLDRLVFSGVKDNGFEVALQRSSDGGATWSSYEQRSYRRASAGFALPSAPAMAAGCAAAEYRQFDFWHGSWSANPNRSDVLSLLGGCITEENWMAQLDGTSFNMYDRRTGLWTQVWRGGGTLVIQGGLTSGGMVLQGKVGASFQRVTWTLNPNGSVRQRAEQSPDGSTWSGLYTVTYTPR